MDHMSMSHASGAMASMTMSSMAAATSSSSSSGHSHSHGMGDMDMDMGGQAACKMKMYWNWYTIDACFLHEGWHITSRGMFAGSCIGVIVLVIAWEFFKRLQREYDNFIVREWQSSVANAPSANASYGTNDNADDSDPTPKHTSAVNGKFQAFLASPMTKPDPNRFRPTLWQQLVRSLMYAAQIGVAYIVMLLVMYYNGYIFFCILIGAWIGNFLFGADNICDNRYESDACCC